MLTEKMRERNLQTSVITMFIVISVSVAMFASSTSLFSASGASSIVMANYYPTDGETYEYVDHFVEQTTAVNTNTTVSVSIDGNTPIPMTYQGIKNEIVSGDTVARDWHTWKITIPTITEPGKHTFQFFRHYYVWQEVDQYWAEFNSYSTIQSFNIAETSATPSQPPATATVTSIYIIAVITASAITALLVLVMFTLRKRNQQHSQTDHLE